VSSVKLEVFFDYTCPYCLRGHENLVALLPHFPQVEVAWRACEAHPRPEVHPPYCDLAIEASYFVEENGGDMMTYQAKVYEAHFHKRQNIEDLAVLAACATAAGVDGDACRKTVESGQYKQRQLDANDYAYEQSGVWAVPSYRMNGKKLDAVEGVGVSKKQLEAFLKNA
jgi:predicted DsbA family dithiol-disulfide isomerase